MPKLSNPYQCDVGSCKEIKGDSNHWFLIYKENAGEDHFGIMEWDAKRAASDRYLYVCSDSCAQKALQEWLDQAKVRATTKAVA